MGVRMMLVVHTVIQYYRLQTLNECSNNWSSGQSYIVVILSTTVPQMEKNSVLNMIIFVLNNCYPIMTSSFARLAPTALTTRDKASYSHYDVILMMTSFASELATPSVTDERTYGRTPYRA